MAQEKPMKSFTRLIDSAKKATEHKLEDEVVKYPWRRPFNATAPDTAKPSLKRDFEQGLVYPITDDVKGARKAANLEPMPPTAHKFAEQAEKKREIMKDIGTGKKLAFDPEKRTYKY
jgi:heterodisulfide reductase subunit C